MRPARRRFLASAGVLGLAACAQLPSSEPASPPVAAARQQGFLEVNGTRLFYETAGKGEPVVLMHGFSLDTRMWDEQVSALVPRYRVIRYDARGFGQSPPPVRGEAYAHHVDLAALLERLDAQRPHLVGSAMGGRFALDYAVSYPTGLRSLVLIDAVVGGYGRLRNWPWSRAFMASYQPVIDAARRKDIAMAKAAWLAHPLFAAARAQPLVAARLRQMVEDYSGWHFVNPDPARAPEPPTITQLSKIEVPTLALVGERDLSDFHRIAAEVQHRAKNALRRIVPRAGHLANMEAPGEVNEALLGFLAGA